MKLWWQLTKAAFKEEWRSIIAITCFFGGTMALLCQDGSHFIFSFFGCYVGALHEQYRQFKNNGE